MPKVSRRRKRFRNLILVLGDLLTPALSSLRDADPSAIWWLMVEVMEEATYVRHHKKKIAFLFSAMRHFAEELRDLGYTVAYRKLDENGPCGQLQRRSRRGRCYVYA